MSKDKNFERRMIVNRYSNRPPFDLKKPKDSYDILDKLREYPTEDCKNCCKNRIKQTRSSLEKSSKKASVESKNDNAKASSTTKIIPKIIEIFQKVTPSQERQQLTMNKNASIQTLYRNPRRKLGKNIPKHKLMRNLLQNFDSEVDSSKKLSTDYLSSEDTFPCKGRQKYRNSASKKKLFKEDSVINPEVNVNLEIKNKYTEGSCEREQLRDRVDKNTSTTGLIWPPKSREMFHYSKKRLEAVPEIIKGPAPKHGRNKQVLRCSNRPKTQVKISSNQKLSSSSFLDEPPIKDISKQIETNSDREGHNNHAPNCPKLMQNFADLKQNKPYKRDQTYIIGSNKSKKNEVPTRRTLEKRTKEKSFVQTQVDKLNKKIGIRSPLQLNRTTNNGGLHMAPPNANYFGLMDRVRLNVPKIENKECQIIESEQDWSDSNNSNIIPDKITFPKETKTAVDQHLSGKKTPIPLSKFSKKHQQFRPAVPKKFDEKQRQYESQESKNKRKSRHGVSSGVSNERLNLPCQKNLLCARGDQHQGSCGYIQNKVVY